MKGNLLLCILFTLCHLSYFLKPDSDSVDDEEEELAYGSHVLVSCRKWSRYVIHDYAVVTWAISFKPEDHPHAINWLAGSQHLPIEQVVVKMKTSLVPT